MCIRHRGQCPVPRKCQTRAGCCWKCPRAQEGSTAPDEGPANCPGLLPLWPACPLQGGWEASPLLSSSPLSPDNKAGEKQELCCVSLVAVYPLLSILDVSSMGSAEGITRKHLWRLFSLDLLNSYLERDPTPCELTYKVPTRHR